MKPLNWQQTLCLLMQNTHRYTTGNVWWVRSFNSSHGRWSARACMNIKQGRRLLVSSSVRVATNFQYLSLESCVKRCETSWLTSCECGINTFQQKSCEDLAYSGKHEIRWNVVASKRTPQKGLTNTMTQILLKSSLATIQRTAPPRNLIVFTKFSKSRCFCSSDSGTSGRQSWRPRSWKAPIEGDIWPRAYNIWWYLYNDREGNGNPKWMSFVSAVFWVGTNKLWEKESEGVKLYDIATVAGWPMCWLFQTTCNEKNQNVIQVIRIHSPDHLKWITQGAIHVKWNDMNLW